MNLQKEWFSDSLIKSLLPTTQHNDVNCRKRHWKSPQLIDTLHISKFLRCESHHSWVNFYRSETTIFFVFSCIPTAKEKIHNSISMTFQKIERLIILVRREKDVKFVITLSVSTIVLETLMQYTLFIHKMTVTQTVKRRSAVGTLLGQSNLSIKLLYNTI